MKQIILFVVLFVAMFAIFGGCVKKSEEPLIAKKMSFDDVKKYEGPFTGKTFKAFHFTGAKAHLFEKALQRIMIDSGATFSDQGIEVKGEVRWILNGSGLDYQGLGPWFEMIVSTDSNCCIMVACQGSDFNYPDEYPYELAAQSAPVIARVIKEHLKPSTF
ncbi:MAG: hypothetical protein QMD50_02350 [Patescibacteria group bacterium]|nr:hypothetical protein [Patescibacteria group bacterium]